MGNNKSSVDTGNGDKLAAFASQYKAEAKAQFQPNQEHEEQIINARKADNVKAKKEKEKKRKKLAKASKKKNKK